MVNETNYEEYLIDYLHQELNPQEEQALLHFLKEHPAAQKEFDGLKQTLLTPDKDMVFEHKEQLYREEKPAMKAVFPIKKYLSIAAVILGLVFTFFLFSRKPSKEGGVAKSQAIPAAPLVKDTAASQSIALDQEPVSVPDTGSDKPLSQKPQPRLKVRHTIQSTTPQREEKEIYVQSPKQQLQDKEEPTPAPVHNLTKEPNREPIVIAQQPAVENRNDQDPMKEDSPAMQTRSSKTVELNPKKQPALFRAINGVLAFKHKVKKTKQRVEQTEVTVMLGNKVLFNINH